MCEQHEVAVIALSSYRAKQISVKLSSDLINRLYSFICPNWSSSLLFHQQQQLKHNSIIAITMIIDVSSINIAIALYFFFIRIAFLSINGNTITKCVIVFLHTRIAHV